MINFKCPHCNFAIRVPDGAAGKKGTCKFCNRVVQVPTIQNETKESLTSSTPSNDSPIFFDCDDVGSNDRKYLVGFSFLVVLALLTSQAFPTPSAWLGRILLVLCVASLIPVVKKHSLQFLRINEGNNWRTNLKLGVFAFIGMILISVSQAGSDRIAEVTRLTEEKAEEEAVKKAELQRLTKKANERVVSAVKTAEIYWQYDNSSKVEETLVSAGNIPHATNFQPIQELRNRMADAQVKDLVSEATELIKAGNIDKGREVVLKALAVPHASSVSQVKKLDNHILNATDAKYNKSRVLKLSDAEFQELQKSGQLPQQFISGFQELDTRIAQLAEVHVKEIVSQRKRELERRERERLAAIAAQKASEEKRLLELAAAKEKMQIARKNKEEALNSRDGSHGTKASVPINQPDSVTVYITNTGTKYHRGSCRHLKKSKIAITLERARAQYSPCKVCNPP
ncbi:hypothetical protein Pan241w_07650 [Gimesia alba]|uniref:Uncharacterized protein n=1 Tax=Gimesia alba TaxID=2527973 RepID=A0A517R9Y6_9PLAN|nr:hypothetical protein [Gimesia alba]QDT40707.1 hypothetical protein Pan241w_07650 [Gimesia alba]